MFTVPNSFNISESMLEAILIYFIHIVLTDLHGSIISRIYLRMRRLISYVVTIFSTLLKNVCSRRDGSNRKIVIKFTFLMMG
jgi:hypothetical protein